MPETAEPEECDDVGAGTIVYPSSASSPSCSTPDESTVSSLSTSSKRKCVTFGSADIFYFDRTQGFICIPSQGGSTLGMTYRHSNSETLTVDNHQRLRQLEHYILLLKKFKYHEISFTQQQLQYLLQRIQSAPGALLGYFSRYVSFRSLMGDSNILDANSIFQRIEKCTPLSDDADFSYAENEELEDQLANIVDNNFLQLLSVKKRRSILRKSGLQTIESSEQLDCQAIRASREICGCSCQDGICLPETCLCAANGIMCQVDRITFPCSCGQANYCQNPEGRVEFDPVRVRLHYLHTKMRLDMARSDPNNSTSRWGDLEELSVQPAEKRRKLNNDVEFGVRSLTDSWPQGDTSVELNSTSQGTCRDCSENRYTHLLLPSVDSAHFTDADDASTSTIHVPPDGLQPCQLTQFATLEPVESFNQSARTSPIFTAQPLCTDTWTYSYPSFATNSFDETGLSGEFFVHSSELVPVTATTSYCPLEPISSLFSHHMTSISMASCPSPSHTSPPPLCSETEDRLSAYNNDVVGHDHSESSDDSVEDVTAPVSSPGNVRTSSVDNPSRAASSYVDVVSA